MRPSTIPFRTVLTTAPMKSFPRQGFSVVDPELVARMARGDARAFEQLYDQSSPLLYTLALRILEDRDDAADLLQDVYGEVWRKGARYEPGRGSAMAWLITLTRSRAIDRLRSRSARGHGVTDSLDQVQGAELRAEGSGPFEARAEVELQGVVGKALAELPEAQRQALELAYYEGLSHAEIAARLNQPVGTIKTRIKLGMSKLRIALRPCWSQE